MNHTTRPLSLSIPDYEHSCVLSAFEMQEVNVENECNATGEMNAVLVNIMGMPRTDVEEVARTQMSKVCRLQKHLWFCLALHHILNVIF